MYAQLQNLDFVVLPDLASVYGAVAPAWKTLDAVEHAQEMIDWIVERELSLFISWKKPKKRPRARRFIPRRQAS